MFEISNYTAMFCQFNYKDITPLDVNKNMVSSLGTFCKRIPLLTFFVTVGMK